MSAPFRIRYTKNELEQRKNQSKIKLQANDGLEVTEELPKNTYDNYLARLVALVPAEVLGIYMILREAILAKDMKVMMDYSWVFWVCLILVLFSRGYGTRVKEENTPFLKQIDWLSVSVTFISFIIWTLNLEGTLPGLDSFCEKDCPNGYEVDNIIIMSTVIVWTFIIPYFLKPQTIDNQ